jgi:dienelactone hydrolase
MRVDRILAGTLLSVLTLCAAFGAQPPPMDDAARAAQAERMRQQNAAPDTPGTGRFPALKEQVASHPDHVVYRPANLAGLGSTKLGLYIFGNGGCSDDAASARMHLLEIASHGYLAIAPGNVLSGPGAPPRPARPPAPPAPPAAPAAPAAGAPGAPAGAPPPGLTSRTSYKDMLWSIDWALAQNADPKSPYYRRIDPNAIAVSGFSCGGVQAIRIGADPRVKTIVAMNTGLFDGSAGLSEMDVAKAHLDKLHTPIFYLLGGETDIAYPNGSDDVKRINHIPVFYANLQGVGHGGTYSEPNGGKAATAVVAWLNWQLRGDKQAAKSFVGKDCGLCTNRDWKVEKKKID